jgi:hypothetical protein
MQIEDLMDPDNRIRKYLIKFLSNGYLNKMDLLISLLAPQYVFKKNSERIIKHFKNISEFSNESDSQKITLSITQYNGETSQVKRMIHYLDLNLSDDLLGAYVHGSLGTYEEIPYSDFDALVIIKDEVFENTKRLSQVALKLIKAKKIMYEMDPLQHHGWFILTENDLKNYPQTYFPHELFEYARSIFPEKGSKLKIYFNPEDQDYKKPFFDLTNSIIKQIELGRIPKNVYQLKGILSQFMLLPALYVQARDKKSVYKKYSFDMAKKDFSEEDWEIMDEISEIRENWHYKMNPIKKKLFTITNPAYRKLITRYFSPKIPNDIKNKLKPEFYNRIKELCKIMSDKI